MSTKYNSRRTAQGSVTIYLILVFDILLVLIVASVTEARRRAMVLCAQNDLDMGLFSIFGEFNRDLLYRYDIFAIDTSYGGEQADYRYTESHLLEYIQYNMQPAKESLGYGERDLLKLNADVVSLSGMELMTDRSGDPLVCQIVEYMKNYYGLGILEDVLEMLDLVSGKGWMNSGDTDRWKDSQEEIERAKQDAGDEKWVSTFENPAESVYSDRSKGVLKLVVSDFHSLSQREADINVLCSHRTLSQGTETTLMESSREDIIREDSFMEHLIVDEYCILKMSHYRNPSEEEPLAYQIEYLLNGKSTDVENLKDTCNQLIGLREIANMAHIIGDEEKMKQLDQMAGAITEAAPYLKIPTKYTLMAAWAFAESVLDVRLLLNGRKVPLVKERSDWKLSLENVKNYKEFLSELAGDQEKEDDTRGLLYVDYLRILLASKNLNRITYRAMDIMELYMRSCNGNTCFRMDACINSVQAKLRVSSKYNQQFIVTQMYSYCY